MFIRIFLGFIFALSSFAQAQTSTPPVDVEVKNTPNVKVVNKVKIEIEEEIPQVEAPIIEEAPTMQTMLQPLFDWRDSLVTSIRVPSVAGECPTSSVYVFGRNVQLNSHCRIFSDVAPFLSPACLLFYACFAGLIILRA